MGQGEGQRLCRPRDEVDEAEGACVAGAGKREEGLAGLGPEGEAERRVAGRQGQLGEDFAAGAVGAEEEELEGGKGHADHLREWVVYIIPAAAKSAVGRDGRFCYNGRRWHIPGEGGGGVRRLPVPWASPGEAVFYIVLMLFAIGTINVFSASFVLAGQLLNDSYFFLKRHLVAFVLGLAGMAVLVRLDYRQIKNYLPLFVLAVLAMLLAVHVSGVDANGARRWLRTGCVRSYFVSL
jgi:hypothetical protein